MGKLLVKLVILAMTKSLTIDEIRYCGYLQEFIDCKLIDFVAGSSVDDSETYYNLIRAEAEADMTELFKFRITL